MIADRRSLSVLELQEAGLLLVEDGNHGEYRPRRDEFSDEGVSFIRAADIDSGRVLFESAQKINDTAVHRIRKGIGAGGDILLSHKGTVGKVAYVPLDAPPFVCSPQTTFWRTLDNNKIDRRYLAAYLNSNFFKAQLYSRQNETDMAGYVSLTAQRSLKVVLPAIEEQRQIATVLGTLDDKIELNRQINTTLESMAQALFKSWFVDFDPVIDNALAAGNDIPEPLQAKAEKRKALGDKRAGQHVWTSDEDARRASATEGASHKRKPLPDGLQQQFPDRFVFTEEMGWVPEGWRQGVLEDLLVLQRGFDLPKAKRTDGTYPLMVASGQDGTHNEFKVRGPGITTGRSGKLGDVSLVLDDFWPLNTTLWVKEFRASSPYHAYYLLKGLELERYNSGSAVPTLNRNHVHNIPLVVPPAAVIAHYDARVEPLYRRQVMGDEQCGQLSNLRDTLLPKLLSGELRIPEAEKQIAEAV